MSEKSDWNRDIRREDVMDLVTTNDHPYVQSLVTEMRDLNTGVLRFRWLVDEVASLMVYEALRDLELRKINVRTPLCLAKGVIMQDELVFVPIIRAGLGMSGAALKLFPDAYLGYFGCSRDEETLVPKKYMSEYPIPSGQVVVLLDPLLATGGSINLAIDDLKAEGFDNIRVVTIIAAPVGIANVHERHPDVKLYTGVVDDYLNEDGYICPGLGDAGKRLGNTRN